MFSESAKLHGLVKSKKGVWFQGEKLFNNVSCIKSYPKECFHVQDKQKGQKETKLVSKICESGLAKASVTQHGQSIQVHLQVLTTTLHQPWVQGGCKMPEALVPKQHKYCSCTKETQVKRIQDIRSIPLSLIKLLHKVSEESTWC